MKPDTIGPTGKSKHVSNVGLVVGVEAFFHQAVGLWTMRFAGADARMGGK